MRSRPASVIAWSVVRSMILLYVPDSKKYNIMSQYWTVNMVKGRHSYLFLYTVCDGDSYGFSDDQMSLSLSRVNDPSIDFSASLKTAALCSYFPCSLSGPAPLLLFSELLAILLVLVNFSALHRSVEGAMVIWNHRLLPENVQ